MDPYKQHNLKIFKTHSKKDGISFIETALPSYFTISLYKPN